jgi:hypothetical protein
MAISTEGKIGIALALIGLAGAGALVVAPAPWVTAVGWALIAVAVAGGIALGVHHFQLAWVFRKSDGYLRPWVGILLVFVILGGGYMGSHWPREQASALPHTAPVAPPAGLKAQSTSARMIFECDKPRSSKDDEAIKKYVALLKNVFGIDATLEPIENGVGISANGPIKPSYRPRFPQKIEITRLDDAKIYVVVMIELPSPLDIIADLAVLNKDDPIADPTREGVEKTFGVAPHKCHLI